MDVMKRKIIQIVSNICTQNNKPIETLYALCEDGSIWENSFVWEKDKWSGWKSIPKLLFDDHDHQPKILAIHPQFMID